MTARRYQLGRRQADVDRTRYRILAAARELVTELGTESSVGKVAQRAGVSRITVYNQFRSKAGLLEALAAEAGRAPSGAAPGEAAADPLEELKLRIERACAAWAADPRLHRQLVGRALGTAGVPLGAAGVALGAAGVISRERSDDDHGLAETLAAHDRLRPGCSIKEAEDVIGILTSFPVFDRLHKEGRRSTSAVVEILLRMASGFIAERLQV
jgi:AcrR family transcriptional regulator